MAPKAGAFWPFYTANAASNGVIPSASTPALAAALNSDPNPSQGIAETTDVSGAALVADAGPEGTFANLASSTAAGQISTYVVQPGDTLSEIAKLAGIPLNTILWANGLSASQSIHAGERLVILPIAGVDVTVMKGDTLASLAKKYGSDATDIADYNGLDSIQPLVVGSTLIIPNGELSTPVASSGSSASSGSESNPYRGGSGPAIDDYYENPVEGAILTQGLHGENAVDLGVPRGTSVHAAADGTVIVAKNNGAWNGGYGNYVVIAHANGTETLYAHMITGSVSVSVGENVSQGEVIGLAGMTGDATGPHVHFEIRGAENLFAATCSVGERTGEFGCD